MRATPPVNNAIRRPAPPPLAAHPPTPPPLPAPNGARIGWKHKLAILLAVAIGSAGFGAFFLPTDAAAPRCPARTQAASENATRVFDTHYSPEIDSETPRVMNVANPYGPNRPLISSPYEQNGPVVSPRERLKPAVAPLRQPGPASNLALLIDRYIDETLARETVLASPLADDAEFLRRAYLDLTGHIPTADRARAFIDSPDPYKRSKLIDELLASSEFGRHFAEMWADVLIKRDPDSNKGLKTDAFAGWLAEQFNQGRSWKQIVTELITADGKEEDRPQVLFVLANQDNNQPAPEKLVGAVANLFMGVPLQCAQCHVHPNVDKWHQKDFWGVAAFFGRTRIEREGGGKNKKGGIPTVKDVDSIQVAAAKDKGKAAKDKGPKSMPLGPVINIPDPNDTKKVTGTARAKFFEGEFPNLPARGSYRPVLAAWLTAPGNPYFSRAAVNRFWAHFFSRGFVNPLEEMTDKNPSSHPALLKELSAEFVRSGYDLKLLIRAICNSNAYQRTSRPLPENQNDERLFSRMPVKVLGARELLTSLAVATSYQEKAKADPGKGKNAVAGNPLVRFFDTRELEDETTEFTYGIPQMLKLMNTNLTNSSAEAASRIVRSAGGNKDKALEEIYLTALSRRPYQAEVKRMAEYVAKRGDPAKGYAGVFWALLNSAEFATNR